MSGNRSEIQRESRESVRPDSRGVSNAPLVDTIGMAARLRVRNAWLVREAEARRLPGAKLGHVWWFDPSAVEAVIRQCAGVATSVKAERPELVSLNTLAAECTLSRSQLNRLVQTGRLPAFRVGGAYVVDPSLAREIAAKHLKELHSPKKRGQTAPADAAAGERVRG